ncbi:ubiquitinyl hydrolase 1 [Trifolium repens]|nr:ubiquitinyl hydrolase 1 [Trifolium repens]
MLQMSNPEFILHLICTGKPSEILARLNKMARYDPDEEIGLYEVLISTSDLKFRLMHIVNIGLSLGKKMSQRQKVMHHIGKLSAA